MVAEIIFRPAGGLNIFFNIFFIYYFNDLFSNSQQGGSVSSMEALS